MGLVRLVAAVTAACVVGTVAGAAERVVPSEPIVLTKPPSGQLDNLFEMAATPSGFIVTYARSAGSIPPFTLFTQRFTKAGKAVGGPAKIDGPGVVGM